MKQSITALECPSRILMEIAAIPGKRAGARATGVLFGQYEDGVVSISGWRTPDAAATSSEVLGRLFDEDTELLRAADSASSNAKLRDLRPVGLFAVNTSGELELSDGERTSYLRIFPQSWQIALVVRAGEKATARFFGRGDTGTDGGTVVIPAIRNSSKQWPALAIFGWLAALGIAAGWWFQPDLLRSLFGE